MNIKQGEVWEVEFFPNIGSEIGKKDLPWLSAMMRWTGFL